MLNLLKFLSLGFLLLSFQVSNAGMVNLAESIFKWHGSKIGGGHDGTVNLKSATVTMKDGILTGGEFIIDLTTINDTDLSGEYKAKLEGHLKSEDFFNVEKYPTATLKIKKVEDKMISGDLTIRDKTNPIRFTYVKEGNHYKGTMKFDRSKFDVKYGSKSFFKSIGDKVIYDDIDIIFDVLISP